MSEGQKVIKVLAICFAIFLIVNILGWLVFGISAFARLTLPEEEITLSTSTETVFETSQTVQKVEISLQTANLILCEGDELKVNTQNLGKTISSKVQNDTLHIKEEKQWSWANHTEEETVFVTIPKNTTLRKLEIEGGTGRIEIEKIEAEELELQRGVGLLDIKESVFGKADIEGGTGDISITKTSFSNLDFEAGIGNSSIEANISEKAEIACGVGEINLTLLGNEDDYLIIAEKGLGEIKINGQKQGSTQIKYGSGNNRIKVEGGIGNITIDFKEVEV